jgi:hypothetical protein
VSILDFGYWKYAVDYGLHPTRFEQREHGFDELARDLGFFLSRLAAQNGADDF